MEQIVIENIPISFTRKNIKNINIRIVSPDGEVRVSAPIFMSMRKVEKFVTSKKDWILKSQQKVSECAHEKYQRLEPLFRLKEEGHIKEYNNLKKIYEDELLSRALPIFKKWEFETGLKPKSIVVRWPKTVWGSCNKNTGRIMLSGMLVVMDERFLDYIILHELTHLKFANHGPDFKNFMTEHMPTWQDTRSFITRY